jgi:hypothetical protein
MDFSHGDFLEEVWESCCGIHKEKDHHDHDCHEKGHHHHEHDCHEKNHHDHNHECHGKDDSWRDDCHCKHTKNCICIILSKLEKSHKLFNFKTKSGDDFTGFIKCFDKCTGCVIIIQPEMKSPKLPAIATIISCSDIESISFEVKHR